MFVPSAKVGHRAGEDLNSWRGRRTRQGNRAGLKQHRYPVHGRSSRTVPNIVPSGFLQVRLRRLHTIDDRGNVQSDLFGTGQLQRAISACNSDLLVPTELSIKHMV